MNLQFLGGVGTVTGSRFLIKHGDLRVLIDAGLYQGYKNLRLRNWDAFPFDVTQLDAVILTHAHLDHSGAIPLLVKRGYRGRVYSTHATADLCQILLPDSGFLQEEEARFANLKHFSKHSPALPLYTFDEAKASLEHFQGLGWKASQELVSRSGQDRLRFEFHPAGHLPGAATVLIQSDKNSIAFSGDLGRKSDPMVRDPDFVQGADTVVIESTYGDRQHPQTDPEEQLRDVVMRTHARGGTLLIPSFAVGRAQLILYYLLRLRARSAIPASLPIYMNSPMAADANRAFSANPGEFKLSRTELQELWKGVHIVRTPEESKALNLNREPAIIIAASGMATGGRVLHHLKSLGPNPQNAILFAGYQAGGTRGDAMLKGAEQIKLHGEYVTIRAEVIGMETLSAHADADELINWLRGLTRKPRRVFVAHGEPDAADTLRHRIESELTIDACVPDFKDEVEL
jgi:metallo-beta-lactamase family protein